MTAHPSTTLPRTLSIGLGLLLATGAASAQLRSHGRPAPLRGELLTPAPETRLAFFDAERFRREDAENESRGVPGPLRFGAPLPANISMDTHGTWDATDDGQLVWRTRIVSPGAHSLGLQFSEFRIPDGAALHLYSPDLETHFGAYTNENEQPDGEWAIEPFPGDAAILEYTQPAELGAVGRIAISHVVHDYRDLAALERRLDVQQHETHAGETGGGGGGCTVDVNCPSGDPYDNQKRATVRTVYFGGLCSGSLINNTANDGTQYLYTAAHCGQGTGTTVRFSYENSICGGGGAPTNRNISGLTLLANHVSSDGRLMRINNAIPASWAPYFSGWNRTTSSLNFGLSMHHPGGAPKCISIDNNGGGPTVGNFIGIGLVSVWGMSFQVGGTAGGSSGGPLWDQNLRLRGALTGGPSNCAISEYGRLDVFWNNTNISTYLDPLGSGVSFHGDFDPYNPGQGDAPEITSISPAEIPAVAVDGNTTIELLGTGFLGTTGVTVDGVQLGNFPPEFSVVNDGRIEVFSIPALTKLGAVNVEIQHPEGDTVAQLDVIPNIPPALDVPSEFLFTVGTLDIAMGSDAGDYFYLTFSPELIPSVLPGYVSMDIGNNFATLFNLATFAIPPSGRVDVSLPLNPSYAGLSFYLQGAVFDLSGLPAIWPLQASNWQQVTILF
jgi:hypothetical protein